MAAGPAALQRLQFVLQQADREPMLPVALVDADELLVLAVVMLVQVFKDVAYGADLLVDWSAAPGAVGVDAVNRHRFVEESQRPNSALATFSSQS